MYTKDFSNISKEDVDEAGGKGASLGEMTGAGVKVPPGFVILSSAFEKMLDEHGLREDIDATLHMVDREVVHTVDDASEKIRGMIESVEIPSDIATSILDGFKKLDAEFVAVRSSATSEDSADAAWAGQLETYLNTTENELLDYVKKCWSSLFTPRAIFYRFEQGLHGKPISVAVVIQKMIESEKSGIAFSVHPVTQDYNQLIIEAGYGLGESIVSGQVTPDSYVIEKDTNTIIECTVQTQSRKFVRDAKGGNVWKDLPEDIGSSRVLTDKEVIELCNMIKNIEKHYGFPIDVEWAFENGEFFITQSRPITTLAKLDDDVDENKELSDSERFHAIVKRKYVPLMTEMFLTSFMMPNRFKKMFFFEHEVNAGYVDGVFYYGPQAFTFSKKVIAEQDRDSEYLVRVFDGIYKIGGELIDFSQEINKTEYGDVALEELLEIYREFYNRFTIFALSLIGFYIQFPVEERLRDMLKGREDIDEELSILTFPKKENIASVEMADLWRLSIEIHGEGVDSLAHVSKLVQKKIESHCEKYGWINTRGGEAESWTSEEIFRRAIEVNNPKDLLNVVKTRAKKQKIVFERLISELELDEKLRQLVSVSKELVYFRTYRTDYLNLAMSYIRPLFEEIGRRRGLSYQEMLNLQHDEILNSVDVSKSEIKERMDGYSMFTLKRGEIIFTSNSEVAEEWKSKYCEKVEIENSEIVGSVASKGIARGVVKIIRGRADFDRIKDGDILVTSMTTPNMVPIMEKAAAFVTDEGGITCHAAIVSREMGKPCIIGTKTATSVLEDGMEVEVDAENGIVKIIK